MNNEASSQPQRISLGSSRPNAYIPNEFRFKLAAAAGTKALAAYIVHERRERIEDAPPDFAFVEEYYAAANQRCDSADMI